MALINVTNVVVLDDNGINFSSPFRFEITFECTEPLQDDIEWKVCYVGNANDPSKDQTLEDVIVGPISVGVQRFLLQSAPPDASQIAIADLIGNTVLLVTCSYMDQEFIQIGYYVRNEYHHPNYDPEGPLPSQIDTDYVFRFVKSDEPRVTRHVIDWSGNGGVDMSLEEHLLAESGGDMFGAIEDMGGDIYALSEGQTLLPAEEDTIDVDTMQTESSWVI